MRVGDALNPSPMLLCKLGSIMVHVEELHSSDGHTFDKVALDQLLMDPEVIAWRDAMETGGFLPVKRKKREPAKGP